MKTFDQISYNSFCLWSSATERSSITRDRSGGHHLRKNVHPSPLSPSSLHDGQYWSTWGRSHFDTLSFLDLYRVCLLNHLKKNYRHLQCFLTLYSFWIGFSVALMNGARAKSRWNKSVCTLLHFYLATDLFLTVQNTIVEGERFLKCETQWSRSTM